MCMMKEDSPAGKLRTPAPTILLMRLKTSFGIVAVPPLSAPPLGSSAVAEASDERQVLGTTEAVGLAMACCRVGVTSPATDWQQRASKRMFRATLMVILSNERDNVSEVC
jgi:hypothetical protein